MATERENTQLFQVAAGNQVHSTGDDAAQERFLAEISYADFYAKQIGSCLGMQAFTTAIVQDTVEQVAFSYIDDSVGNIATVNGFVSARPKSLGRIIIELMSED